VKSRKAQKRSSQQSRQAILRKLLGRASLGALEKLEPRQMMTAQPWTDGLYYPGIGQYTAFLPTNLSYQEYAARSEATGASLGGSSGPMAEGAGSFSTVSEQEPNNRLQDAQFLNLGTAPGKDTGVNVLGTLPVNNYPFSRQDEDYYSFDLRAGDVLDAQIVGGGFTAFDISIMDSNGWELTGNNHSIPQGIYGQSSPLSSVGPLGNPLVTTNLALTIPKTGRYYARVSDGDVSYTMALRVYRSPLESTEIGTKQKIFVDFNGAFVRGESFGSIPGGTKRLSPLASFLPTWGLTAGDENAMIDKIMASLKARFTGTQSLPTNGGNGWFSSTGSAGQFDVEFLNSRDNPDSFGDPNVSRLIIGGTQGELGVNTIGIAETVDVGNFTTNETAVILLDLINTPGGFGLVPLGPRVTRADFLADAIGRVAAHEAGHFLGGWHTINNNSATQIMDAGGSLQAMSNLMGVGPDGIYGTDDDIHVGFGVDNYDRIASGISFGRQDSAATLAYGMATGTVGAYVTGAIFLDSNSNRNIDAGEQGLAGWQVFADLNGDGVYQTGEPQARSGADGMYSLALGPGNYTIRETLQLGYSQTAPVGKSYSVSVTNGSIITGKSFGNARVDLTATGFKWNDSNGNGLVDSGEPRMQGVWFYVDLDGDQSIDIGEPSAISDSNGRYTLRFPGPGTYTIREVLSPGFVQTFPGAATNFAHVVTVTGNPAIDTLALAGLNFGNRLYLDLGDAPNSYGTLRSSNGAAHGFVTGLFLGQNWDADADGQPSADALGDDNNGLLDPLNGVIDDEDGVTLARPLARSAANLINVTATNLTSKPAYIHAWIDLNGDGDFTDSGEKIVSNAELAAGLSGTQTVSIPALGGAKLVNGKLETFVRVRLSQDRDLGPTGLSASGEVEDYAVTVVDTPQIAVDDSFQVSSGVPLNVLDVTANDFRVPGEVLEIISAGPPHANGAVLQITSDNKLLYTPPSGFVGQDFFTYTIRNSSGETATANVTVDVSLFFENPMAIDDSYDVPTNAVSYPLNVLANDIEGQSGALSIISVTQPNLGGQISIASGGQSLLYTPLRGVGSTEQFTYTVADSSGKSSTATVTLHTLPGDQTDDEVQIRLVPTDLNGNPIASIPQGEDFRVEVRVEDLRDDKSPPGSPPYGVYAAYLDLLYNLQLVSTNPSAPGSRLDFDVQFLDQYDNVQLGDASIPGIIDDFGAVNSNGQGGFTGERRLASVRFTARSPGRATFTPDPADNPPLTDTLLYFVSGNGVPVEKIRFVPGTIEIVGDSVEFPQAVDDSFATNVPKNTTRFPLNVMANDRPGSTNVISLDSVGQPAHGFVTIDNNGTPTVSGDDRILYTPVTDFEGNDSFTYTIKDARGIQSSATVTVRVGSTTATNADDDVSLRLQLYKADGTPLADGETLTVGSQFQLRGFVQDLRNPFGSNRGVFAAFEDILYSSGLVSPVANDAAPLGFQISFDPAYQRGAPGELQSGDIRVPGLINEVGALQAGDAPLGTNELPFFTITFTANSAGTASFIGDPADIVPFHDTLLFEPPTAVPANHIRYGFDSVTIVAATGAGGEGNTNTVNALDVNADGVVSPIDVLNVINALNAGGSRALSGGGGEGEAASKLFLDVNADGSLSPMDALLVINFLNARGLGEGESQDDSVPLILSNRTVEMMQASDASAASLVELPSSGTAAAASDSGQDGANASSSSSGDWSTAEGEGEDASQSLEDLLAELAPDVDSTWKRK
jgi:hypothetical protein